MDEIQDNIHKGRFTVFITQNISFGWWGILQVKSFLLNVVQVVLIVDER
jgi:hypothetical protein